MRPLALVTIALVLAAPGALAEEARLSFRFEGQYDPKVTSADGGREDVILEFGPILNLKGEHKHFDYSIQHHSFYEKYVDLDNLDDWSHQVQASATWRINSRLDFNISDRFSQRPRLVARDPDGFNVGEILPEGFSRNPVNTNVFNATLRATPTSRLSAIAAVSHFYREFDDPSLNQQDTDSLTTTGQLNYRLSARHTVGSGFRFRRRNFSTNEINDANTDVYDAFATWAWNLDAATTFTARAGPAWSSDKGGEIDRPRYGTVFNNPTLLADPATCRAREEIAPDVFVAILDGSCQAVPGQILTNSQVQTNQGLDPVPDLALLAGLQPFDEGEAKDETNVTLFFSFALSRRWDRVDASVIWTRSDSETQSLGAATTLDAVALRTSWEITPKMRGSLAFQFTRRLTDRNSKSEFPVFGPLLDVTELGGGTLSAGQIIGSLTREDELELVDDIYNVNVRLARDVGESATVFAGAIFRRTEQRFETEFRDDRNTRNDWDVTMGFNYRFRPIRF